MLMIFLQLNVHHWVLRAVVASFAFRAAGKLTFGVGRCACCSTPRGACSCSGLQIAAPVMLATMVMDVTVGFISKASPQLPALFIGVPPKTLLGLRPAGSHRGALAGIFWKADLRMRWAGAGACWDWRSELRRNAFGRITAQKRPHPGARTKAREKGQVVALARPGCGAHAAGRGLRHGLGSRALDRALARYFDQPAERCRVHAMGRGRRSAAGSHRERDPSVGRPAAGHRFVLAVGSTLAQGRHRVCGGGPDAKLSRLNPASNLQQLFSLAGLSRVLRSLLPTSLILFLAVKLIQSHAEAISHAAVCTCLGLLAQLGSLLRGARLEVLDWFCSPGPGSIISCSGALTNNPCA